MIYYYYFICCCLFSTPPLPSLSVWTFFFKRVDLNVYKCFCFFILFYCLFDWTHRLFRFKTSKSTSSWNKKTPLMWRGYNYMQFTNTAADLDWSNSTLLRVCPPLTNTHTPLFVLLFYYVLDEWDKENETTKKTKKKYFFINCKICVFFFININKYIIIILTGRGHMLPLEI